MPNSQVVEVTSFGMYSIHYTLSLFAVRELVCNCSYLLVMTLHSELQWCVFLYFKYLQLCVWLIDSIVRLVQCSSSSRFLSLFLLRLRNCTRELHRFLTLVLFVISRICADNLPVSVALFAGMHGTLS